MAEVITELKAHRPPVFVKSAPILRMGTSPENANGIFNPATLKNGSYYLYCREEDANGVNRIRGYKSKNGITIDQELGTVLEAGYKPNGHPVGYEDPRGWVDPLTGKAYLVVVENNGKTQRNCLAVSDDYVHFKMLGPMSPYNRPSKDGAIMGRMRDRKSRIRTGEVIGVDRPMIGNILWGMRVTKAKDVEGPYEDVAEYLPRADWEGVRTGASEFVHIPGLGYIGMHHGASKPNGHWYYSSGLDLFNEQGEMIASAAEPQLVPTTRIEKEGAEGKEILLDTGLVEIVRRGKRFLRGYAGAGDHCVVVAEAPLKDCIDYLFSPRNRVEKHPGRRVFSFN